MARASEGVLTRRHLQIWALMLMVGASAVAAQTRATTGDLRVIAVDGSGLPVAGVRVLTSNMDTGIERTTITGQDGHATTSALAVGGYTMRAMPITSAR